MQSTGEGRSRVRRAGERLRRQISRLAAIDVSPRENGNPCRTSRKGDGRRGETECCNYEVAEYNILIHPCRVLRPSPFPPAHANRPPPSVPLIDTEGRVARRRTAIILKSIKCHRGFLSRSNVRSAQAPRHPNLRRVRRRIIDEAAALAVGRREIADNSVNPQVRSYAIRHFTLKAIIFTPLQGVLQLFLHIIKFNQILLIRAAI